MRIARLLTACAAAALIAGCSTLPGWIVFQGRSTITDYRHFHNLDVAPAPDPLPLPPAAEPARLPELHVGETFEQLLERNGTVAFIVLQDGQVRYERYFHGYRRDSIATSFSMAKSVVALLLGVMIDEGRIGGVDDPLTRYLPELAARDPRFAQVTLKNLLEMRSGIAFTEEYGSPWSQAARFYLTPDLRSEIAGMAIEAPPDTRYRYSSGDTQLLGVVLERASGQPLGRLLEQRLWQPMGAEYGASWSQDSAEGGVSKAFCCLNARAIDFARLGQLVLQQGQVRGAAVVPRHWIAEMLQVREHPGEGDAARRNIERFGSPQAAFYTWQWRRIAEPDPAAPGALRPSDGSFAEGLYGQFIYVAPRQRMVIVRLGARQGKGVWWPALMARIAAMNG